jgi:perosamine synthetase
MTTTGTAPSVAASEPGRFLLPREPRLTVSLLNPFARVRALPPPFDTKPTFYLFWARNALYHGLHVLGLSTGDTVLVPAFHCASLVEPLIQHGATVRFYRVDRDCVPDLDDIRTKIDEKTRAVLTIHYFGFPGPIRDLRDLCTHHGLFLIEDCAHLLAGRGAGGALGEFGDISIFSWRKLLPVYDGGQLVVNNPALRVALPLSRSSAILRLRVWKNMIDKLIDDAPGGGLRRLSGLARWLSSAARRVLSRRASAAASLTINNYGLHFDRSSLNVPMSGPSLRILRTVDVEAITKLRRGHYRMLLTAVADIPDLMPLHRDLPEGVCPWVFPLVARGRASFHRRLRARGIPATTWGEVIHSDLPLHEFAEAQFLYENLIFLPIHQSLTPQDLQTMVAILREEMLATS